MTPDTEVALIRMAIVAALVAMLYFLNLHTGNRTFKTATFVALVVCSVAVCVFGVIALLAVKA